MIVQKMTEPWSAVMDDHVLEYKCTDSVDNESLCCCWMGIVPRHEFILAKDGSVPDPAREVCLNACICDFSQSHKGTVL